MKVAASLRDGKNTTNQWKAFRTQVKGPGAAARE